MNAGLLMKQLNKITNAQMKTLIGNKNLKKLRP